MDVIFDIDGYKLDHRRQYPEGTEYVYSNWTPRASRNPEIKEVVFVGLQYFLKHYLEEEFGKFFKSDVDRAVERYQKRIDGYLGPNEIGTEHIRALHDLGYLPLRFKALPEGTSVPLRVPMLTVENTHPDFAWLVNYLETIMSATLWVPSTSATLAKRLRGVLLDWAEKTGSPAEFVDWQGHDFSFRGMAGLEAAQMSGIGHLTQFTGTDTIPAIEFAEDYYPSSADFFIGGSVAATEHSVMCAGGDDNEEDTYRRLIDLYPSGILSVVSDTWDLWKVLTETVPNLKDEILARDGKLVIRPDSGDPVDIVCGTARFPHDKHLFPDVEGVDDTRTAAEKGVVELLWETFGGTITETGHKLLDSHVGVIYGDAINYERMQDILSRLEAKGFASANMVFGVGSFTYQYNTRDTFGFAMKATNVVINGVEKPIFKDPKTDNGDKKSLKGRLAVIKGINGRLIALDEEHSEVRDIAIHNGMDLLTTVWEDGRLLVEHSFEDVRKRAQA
jgi:nicotinamide phosphoribosyltransferase